MKKKIFKSIFLVMFFCLVYNFTEVKADSEIITITDKTLMGSEFSWAPQYDSAKGSSFEPIGKNSTSHKDFEIYDDAAKVEAFRKNHIAFRITSKDQIGKIGIRYKNVGKYNGEVLDLEIRVINWQRVQQSNKENENYPTIFFKTDSIGIDVTGSPAIDSPMYSFKFYKHGTSEEVKVKGHLTFKDIDGDEDKVSQSESSKEFIIPFKGYVDAYVVSGSDIKKINGRIINNSKNQTTPTDKKGMVTMTFDGELQFVYSRLKDEHFVEKDPENSRYGYTVAFEFESLVPNAPFKPTKSVSVDEITGTDSFYYTINHKIECPFDSINKYTEYVLSDKIADCLNIESIEINDNSGEDITSWFDIKTDNNLVEIKAKSTTLEKKEFYSNEYVFKINVKKKANYDMSSWYNGTECIIPNQAKLSVTSKSLGKNESTIEEVDVKCNFRITTFIDHGIITPNIDKISAGADQTITFKPQKGYYIEKIIVDGVELDNIKINSYEFKNIDADHDVNVYTEPMKAVIKIDKQDAETGKKCQNGATFKSAEYEIYKDAECTQFVEKLIIDENGYATSSELSLVECIDGEYIYNDTYYVKETIAPIGYNIDEKIYEVFFDVTTSDKKILEDTVVSKEVAIELEEVETGDINVLSLVMTELISILGIVSVVIRNKKQNA